MADSVVVIALTETGSKLARTLKMRAKDHQVDVQTVVPVKYAQSDDQTFSKGAFNQTLTILFKTASAVICVMATGIVVRTIAPLIKDKRIDPAVLVMDEQGQHVISLLSGHVGGANQLANQIGTWLNAEPVITTATDVEGVQALDVLAKELNAWYPEFKNNTKWINGRLVSHEPVHLIVDDAFQAQLPMTKGFHRVQMLSEVPDGEPVIVVTDHLMTEKKALLIPVIPQCDVLGIGCRKDVTIEQIQSAFATFCQEHQLAWQAISKICSIDVKAHETAIHYLADTLQVPAEFYSADLLNAVSNRYPQSEFVKKTVGVGNVACASADYGSGEKAVTERFSMNEITMALGRQNKKVGS